MSRIPPSLESYLILPPDTSLILLTSVLGASPNWLLLRYLYGVLRPEAHGGTSFASAAPPGIGEDGVHNGPGPAAEGGTETKVILVSFIRDFASWRQYAARMGMHLEKLGRQRRFVFVDGLSWSAGVTGIARAGSPSELWLRSLAGVGGVEGIGTVIHAAMDDLRPAKPDGASGGKIVLVVDQLDFLLATSGEEVTRADLHDMLLDLREKVHATIVSVAADEPLLQEQYTSLEREHAAFVVALAHQADIVLSLRRLKTGTAKDVHGMLRITRGGGSGRRVEEKEFLYRVGGDGGVCVFSRAQQMIY